MNGVAASSDKFGAHVATQMGVARQLSSEGHEYAYGPIDGEWTFLSLAALGTAKSALVSQCGPTTNRRQAYLVGNMNAAFGIQAGSLAFASGETAGSTTVLAAASAIDADVHAYLGVHRADGTEELWRDRAIVASRSRGVLSLSDTAAKIRIEGISTYTGWYSATNSHLLDIVWGRGITPPEAEEIAQNPWQLFRADPLRIYSLPSGPIVPISLSIAVSNITSSGSRNTVTLGF